ncbi:hypothetical protein GT347_18660 [Xylophilus rhododendri]|uniref:Uncharacterized protein n=1 Tax=Xylophilus rhododendri TaxID=2697032 RepID=A0A857J769_9BURK|nr:PP0621 family protein [Xylophilus rhododendri]QHI99824.1 hypothetical protein GT347_18660 [Xylophilus rhododendri]
MKLLMVLAAVALLVWLLRGDRRKAVQKQTASRQPRGPEAMVQCAACGLHLPATDALPGPGEKMYCCAEHRRASD